MATKSHIALDSSIKLTDKEEEELKLLMSELSYEFDHYVESNYNEEYTFAYVYSKLK